MDKEYLSTLSGREFMHFKGKKYKFLGLVKHKKVNQDVLPILNIVDIKEAAHTETDECIVIYQTSNGEYYSTCDDELVFYQAEYGDNKLWVRPVDMFLSKVDKVKHPQASQEYRFELIK